MQIGKTWGEKDIAENIDTKATLGHSLATRESLVPLTSKAGKPDILPQ